MRLEADLPGSRKVQPLGPVILGERPILGHVARKTKPTIPLTTFHTIKEVHLKVVLKDERRFLYERHQVLIAPDPHSGCSGRYSVIHIQVETGQASMLGREVPLRHARQLTSDFLVSLGDNVDGTPAYCSGYTGTRKLYEHGQI